MDASKIKKYAIGGSGFIFAVTLIVFAMAVAQRDARTKDPTGAAAQISYSNQAAEGISHDPDTAEGPWPPPVVRSNDSELGDSQLGDSALAEAHQASMPTLSSVSGLSDLSSAPQLPSTASLSDASASEPSLHSLGGENPLRGASNSLTALAPNDSVEPPALGALANSPEITSSELPSIHDLSASLPPTLPSTLPPLGGLGAALGSPAELPNTLADEPDLSAGNNQVNSLPPLLSNNTSPEMAHSPFVSPQLPVPQQQIQTPTPSPLSSPALPSNTITSDPADASDGFSGSGDGLPNALPTLSQPANLAPAQQPLQPQPLQPQLSNSRSLPQGLPDAVSNRSSLNAAMVSSAAGAGVGAGAAALLSSAAPGVRQLEGAQNPSLEIQKRAPSEVQVGVPATFTLVVRNVGTASAFDVAVHDSVPKGAKLVRTTPTALVDGEGKILWKLGEMAAGSEQVLTLDLTPETEGELGSVASVTFAAQASVRTMSTQPKLALKQTVGSTVLGGEVASIVIEVSNVGTGTARDVELEEDVPANMRHASGVSTLGLTIGDLAPGESEKVVIELTGVSAGQAINRIRAIASNNTACESEATINVVLPKLVVNLEGPRLRYLERQATYRASITNSGTAIAHDIELVLHLPRGLEYTSAANEGTYLREQHTVVWSLAELAAGATVNTEVTLLPVQEGEFSLRMQCDAVGVQAEAIDKKVQVEGQSELAFSIEDDNDPIETDGLTTYIVRITNGGTRIDSNVQLVFEVPEGSVTEQVHAPVNHQPSQRTIVFAPIPKMQPKDNQTYRIAVRHSREGTIVARAQLKSDNRPVPVIKEESTHVYRDN